MFKKLFSRSKRKGHSRRQKEVARDRRSRLGELRRFNIPRLVMAERFSQKLVRRKMDPFGSKPDVVSRRVKYGRLPIVGLRSQRERFVDRGQEKYAYKMHEEVPREVQGERSVCSRRADRREVLFGMRIAGRGRRRSPGQGGTYRRTVESEQTCRRS